MNKWIMPSIAFQFQLYSMELAYSRGVVLIIT